MTWGNLVIVHAGLEAAVASNRRLNPPGRTSVCDKRRMADDWAVMCTAMDDVNNGGRIHGRAFHVPSVNGNATHPSIKSLRSPTKHVSSLVGC